jgi:hypothetical protein
MIRVKSVGRMHRFRAEESKDYRLPPGIGRD